jgi:hypothetical protein
MSLESTFPCAILWAPCTRCRLQRSWSPRSSRVPACGGRLGFSLSGLVSDAVFVACQPAPPPPTCFVPGWHWLPAISTTTITGCRGIGRFAVPEVRGGTRGSLGSFCWPCLSCVSLRPPHPQLIAAIFSCFPFLFPAHLAWHSLGLKPCARRPGPFCFAPLQRALRVSAPPPTFPICRKTGSRKSCRSPRKSTPPGLGAAASRCPGAQAKRAEKE